MYKHILAFFIVFLLLGCEKKDPFDDVIAKLQSSKVKKQATQDKPKIKQKQPTIVSVSKTPQTPPETKHSQTLINKEPQKLVKNDIKDLNLTTTSNQNISLRFLEDGIEFKDFEDKIVILDIFTTWCPPCIESFPHLSKLQKKYKKDLKVIGILMEENRKNEEIEKFMKKHHINYPVSNTKENFTLVDTWGGVSGYPTIIIFDKKGRYFNHYNGSPPIEMLITDIKKALRKK